MGVQSAKSATVKLPASKAGRGSQNLCVCMYVCVRACTYACRGLAETLKTCAP